MDAMTPEPADDPIDALAATPEAAELLGLAATLAPRPELRGQVLAAAAAARAPGRPAAAAPTIGAPEALRGMLAEISTLVASLDPVDAARPTIEGWTVAGLLGHLTAIEEHFGAVLGWWPEPGPIENEHDHLAMTTPAARAAMDRPFNEVRERWVDMVDRVVARLSSLDDRLVERVAFHGFDFSIRSLVVARTFEVWTHSEDICRAIGRPVPELDTARLQVMTAAAVGALPIGMVLTGGDPRGRSVRIVLEGPGGGSWVQALDLGAAAGEPSLTLVADAVEFCRLAARRTPPDELRCTIIGDEELAGSVLAAAAVFAA